jgi:hypothetical protein
VCSMWKTMGVGDVQSRPHSVAVAPAELALAGRRAQPIWRGRWRRSPAAPPAPSNHGRQCKSFKTLQSGNPAREHAPLSARVWPAERLGQGGCLMNLSGQWNRTESLGIQNSAALAKPINSSGLWARARSSRVLKRCDRGCRRPGTRQNKEERHRGGALCHWELKESQARPPAFTGGGNCARRRISLAAATSAV